MRKFITILSIIAIISLATVAMAADVVINSKVQSTTTELDKNGNEYVRVIINKTYKLQGVEYEKGVAVMAFREHVPAIKQLKAGDTLKAICSEREYKGRTSYTILKLLSK